jgi:hypothetical protein
LAYGNLLIGRIPNTCESCTKIKIKKQVIEMGRISVELPDELEKKLRFKTIERFGGKKGDLSKAVEEAVKTWVALGK